MGLPCTRAKLAALARFFVLTETWRPVECSVDQDNFVIASVSCHNHHQHQVFRSKRSQRCYFQDPTRAPSNAMANALPPPLVDGRARQLRLRKLWAKKSNSCFFFVDGWERPLAGMSFLTKKNELRVQLNDCSKKIHA